MDAELVERCRRRDREAQRQLYDRCADRVYRVLRRMTRNPDDAFDLAQDTFIRVFEKIDTFDATSSLTTWVYRIAVNEALQFLRRRRLSARTLLRLGRALPESAPTVAADSQLDVSEALTRLPDAERVLIVLRYVEGLSYNEMAFILQKPAGTIASGLNRARQALRAILDTEEHRGSEETPPLPHRIEGERAEP